MADWVEAHMRGTQIKMRKADAREAERQARLRAGREPLASQRDLGAALAQVRALRSAIRRHREAIESAGDVFILVGRDRARRKHAADQALWQEIDRG